VMFSARPSSYLIATPTNWLYGGVLQSRGVGERRLFPGLVIVVLAVVGLLLKPPSVRAIVYFLALLAAFEISLGFRGHIYGVLFHFVALYRGLRAPARLGIFVVMFLGILGAYGYTALAGSLGASARRVLAGVLAAALLIEYHVTLPLEPYANHPPPLYRYLAELPPGVVAEFPVPRLDALPGVEAEYAYMSIFHWRPLVNGYSGMYPPTYMARMPRLVGFPDATSFAQLRRDNVRYVIVHEDSYPRDRVAELLRDLLMEPGLRLVGTFKDASDGPAHLFVFR
jgi:hypothetical protein